MKLLFFSLFILTTSSVVSQIVNIESKRMQTDSIRFVLKNDISFSYNNNNGDYIFQVSENLATQFKSKDLRQIYFLIGDYNLIRTSKKDYRNSWFFHFRLNYKVTNLFRLETFIQSQNNKLLDLTNRRLIGAGVRFKAISKENLRLYLGNTYMYEREQSNEFKKSVYNNRNSTYFSISAEIPKSNVSFTNTLYFQPLYSNINDYTILELFKIEIPLSENFNLFTVFNYYYDSNTPKNREQYTSNIKIGLGFQL